MTVLAVKFLVPDMNQGVGSQLTFVRICSTMIARPISIIPRTNKKNTGATMANSTTAAPCRFLRHRRQARSSLTSAGASFRPMQPCRRGDAGDSALESREDCRVGRAKRAPPCVLAGWWGSLRSTHPTSFSLQQLKVRGLRKRGGFIAASSFEGRESSRLFQSQSEFHRGAIAWSFSVRRRWPQACWDRELRGSRW